MSQPALLAEQDICPNCGHLANLLEITGWCPQCTLAHDPSILICPTCGGFHNKKDGTKKCWTCRKEGWLREHADEIEHYLALGLGIEAAKHKVAEDIRPICACCGEPIKGGKKEAKFCRRTAKCEKQQRTYKTLRRTGLSPDVAIAIATGKVTAILSN